MIRDCEDCEQGKHAGCLVTVLAEGLLHEDEWLPCPCAERDHKPKVYKPSNEISDRWYPR